MHTTIGAQNIAFHTSIYYAPRHPAAGELITRAANTGCRSEVNSLKDCSPTYTAGWETRI